MLSIQCMCTSYMSMHPVHVEHEFMFGVSCVCAHVHGGEEGGEGGASWSDACGVAI